MANSPSNISSFIGGISYSNYKPDKHTFSQQESPANVNESHTMRRRYFGNFRGTPPFKKFRGDFRLYSFLKYYL